MDSSIYRKSALFSVVSTELGNFESLDELVANEIILHLLVDSGSTVVKELVQSNNKDDINVINRIIPKC